MDTVTNFEYLLSKYAYFDQYHPRDGLARASRPHCEHNSFKMKRAAGYCTPAIYRDKNARKSTTGEGRSPRSLLRPQANPLAEAGPVRLIAFPFPKRKNQYHLINLK